MDILALLAAHGLKATPTRISVLSLFNLDKKSTYTASEITELMGEHTDRVTIFRTLRTLEERQLLHKIIDYSGVAQYALSRENKSDNHAHFFCIKCERIECVQGFSIDTSTLGQYYPTITEINTHIKGVCVDCG